MRIFVRLVLVIVALSLSVACGEPRRLPPQGAVFGDTLTVYAISGTDLSFPTALNVGALAVVPVSGVFNYQIAFDINAEGVAVLYPVALLAAEETGVRPVGLKAVPGTFEELTSAPRDGYVYDQPLVAPNGQVVAIEASMACPPYYPQVIFAKLVVDSVNVERRAIHFHAVTDPSCGFRSFLPGLPKS